MTQENIFYMVQMQSQFKDQDHWSEYLTFDEKKEAIRSIKENKKYNLRLVKCELLDIEGNRLEE